MWVRLPPGAPKEKHLPKKKNTPTHLVVVLDRSGSMESIRDATIEGMNSFIAQQKDAPGKLTCTIQTFDSGGPFEYPARNLPIAEVVPFTRETYVPRGGTPLYDAVGYEITATEDFVRGKDVAVLFVVMTDGEENSSVRYTRQQLFDIVNYKQVHNSWRFVFLGANQDAYAEGQKMGYSSGYTSNFAPNAAGVAQGFRSLAINAVAYRGTVDMQGAGFAAASTPDFFAQTGVRPDDDPLASFEPPPDVDQVVVWKKKRERKIRA